MNVSQVKYIIERAGNFTLNENLVIAIANGEIIKNYAGRSAWSHFPEPPK